MHRNITFFEVPNSFTKDYLSDFMSSFTFIPKGFGHQINSPTAVCEDRIIGDFELIYIIGGQSTITIDHREYECFPGDIIFIPPFVKHKIQTPADNPHNNYWLHFELFPLHLQDPFINTMLPYSEHLIHLGISTELKALYERLEVEMLAQKPGNMIMFNALLVEILTVILRLNKTAALTEPGMKNRNPLEISLVNKSIAFIVDNTFNSIDIDSICKHMNISQPYLFKAFKHVLKMPPNHFIQLCKIKKAEQLIKTTNLSLKEISEMLCFKSQYYFSNVFKKYYTVSPKKYKQIFMEY